jgi:hypothetical protein
MVTKHKPGETQELRTSIVERLVQTVIEHKALTPADQNLLECLKSHFPNGLDNARLRELALNPSFNRLHGENIRTAVYRVRDKLDLFFKYDSHGKTTDMRLQIPKGKPYRIELVANLQDLDPVERFWDPHFSNDAENMIIYTEPLFFWDEKRRCYLRFLDINDESPSLDAEQVRARIPENHPARELVPCFHYQSSGETQAQRILRKWFEQQGKVRVEVEISRECVEKKVWNHNIVVLGNCRTNHYLDVLQNGLSIVLENDSIKVKGGTGECEREYRDLPASPRESAGHFIYAVVTRMPSIVAQCCVTLIAANHGRAIEKVAEFLTATPNSLDELYTRLNFQSRKPLPNRFQLLFRLQSLDHELVAGKPELVDFRIG